ncbi:UDP-3-O-(3-hydroxymyristoyl)glucosamine N-acyltransferase [Algirhabdus cladophorae]|uniref:UDP-3-O-(3-hydroxymyristoyl)glucosamine N-acyltransferase n=1 Tax=Algirhabdus cladophorae TaxID=3377108 RepID=UPI003B84AE26
MSSFSISQIASALAAQAVGAVDLRVTGASEPASAGPDHLALAMDPKYGDGLTAGQAQAAILWDGADWQALGLKAAIFVPRPRYAMAGLTTLMDAGPQIAAGVHPTAVVDPSAQIDEGAAIGPFVVIGADVRIGPKARIASHVSIDTGAQIGSQALLLQGAKIGARVVLGDRVILQPGACIGSDGFSFVTPEKSGVENVRATLGDQQDAAKQSWTRIHSLGSVHIGDDVEVGANAAIDRGTIRNTTIGRGTKLDNLVHIGHNVQVGEDCLLCGQVGIAGSSTIGNRVVMGGQCGVNDNIFVGDDVIAGGATKIFTNAPAGRVLLGYPAMKMDAHVEAYKGLRRLPRLFRDVAALKKAVSNSDQSD